MKRGGGSGNRRRRARAMQATHIGRKAWPELSGAAFGGLLWGSRMDDRPTIDSPDDDPYLWLEDIEGARALEFVERQSALTLKKFRHPGFARDSEMLAAIFDRPDNIPYVGRRHGLLYNLWKDAKNPRGIWRRTTLEEFRKAEPRWDTLLDIDRLAAEEKADWLLILTQLSPETGARAMLSLSRGGSDAVTLREFDMEARAFVKDGFSVPEAKGGPTWVDSDTLLLSSAYGEGMATSSGYARTIRLWRRGEDLNDATIVFETTDDHMAVFLAIDRTGARPRTLWFDMIDFIHMDIW